MTFESVVDDLQNLLGKRLESIRPGADIVINDLNVQNGRIGITSASGKTKSRPISELRMIWQKLQEQPAVHVDEALHGSGTSRNQPETIMANLSYIEWFRFNNKKHIAYTGKHTHPFGTKKQMSEADAEQLREKLRGNTFDNLATLVVTQNILRAIQLYKTMTGITPVTVCYGVYLFNLSGKITAFVAMSEINQLITEGTYAVINKPAGFDISQQVNINGVWFCPKSIDGLNLMIRL